MPNPFREATCRQCGQAFRTRSAKASNCSKVCAGLAKRVPLAERLWARVDQRGPDECWPWTGATSRDGYGTLGVGGGVRGKTMLAHRAAFKDVHGYLPDEVCHSCDNPPCCNPAHLFAGTHQDNMADRDAKGRGEPNRARGERNGGNKYSAETIQQIRALGGTISQDRIAALTGVSQAQISRILRGSIWKSLPSDPQT